MEIHPLSDPISLTILANIFRGAAVLLLIVAFVPGAILAWLFRRPHA
jgi:hypothetical protein